MFRRLQPKLCHPTPAFDEAVGLHVVEANSVFGITGGSRPPAAKGGAVTVFVNGLGKL